MRTKQPRIVEVLLKLKTFIPFMIGHIGRVSWEYATTLTWHKCHASGPSVTSGVKLKLKLCNADYIMTNCRFSTFAHPSVYQTYLLSMDSVSPHQIPGIYTSILEGQLLFSILLLYEWTRKKARKSRKDNRLARFTFIYLSIRYLRSWAT